MFSTLFASIPRRSTVCFVNSFVLLLVPEPIWYFLPANRAVVVGSRPGKLILQFVTCMQPLTTILVAAQ